MNTDHIKIGDVSYPLKRVQIWVDASSDERGKYLGVNLLANSEDPTTSGFALNGLVFRGLENLNVLAGFKFYLDANADDPDNELGESVIVELGNTLELETVELTFGEVVDDSINITMSASCHGDESQQTRVKASFTAHLQ
ncbi:MAG TPA: hypothetical protein VLD18_11270 [Verrucomicrobiae bacterium]|nr:hypothetical protein [Verrucomicrobiae bacterium]